MDILFLSLLDCIGKVIVFEFRWRSVGKVKENRTEHKINNFDLSKAYIFFVRMLFSQRISAVCILLR